MPYVLILHAVADYSAWKIIFDEAGGLRRAAGEVSYQVLADEHDPGKIVHFSRWTSLAAARAFFESADLVAISKRAGVEAPEFHYLNQLACGDLA